jgi:hypothetical protein
MLVCSAGELFSKVPFTELSPVDIEDILEQRRDEILSLQAIFGEDHVTADDSGAVKVSVDLTVDSKLLAGISRCCCVSWRLYCRCR